MNVSCKQKFAHTTSTLLWWYSIVYYIVYNYAATCDPAELGNSSVSTNLNTPGTATTLNGVITYNGIVVGSTSYVTCNDGYIPKDPSSNRTCMINGNWSGRAQICVPLQVKSCNFKLYYCIRP